MARLQRKSLARATLGTTIVEFALLAPIFFGILTAILETSIVFFAGQVLESGVSDASRAIRVGEVQQRGRTLDEFKADICSRLYGLFGNCADMHVRVTAIDNFESADFDLPLDPDCEEDCDWTEPQVWSPGIASSVVLVQVYYRYPTILQLGPFASTNLADGSRLMSAAAIFRNEPF